MSASSAAGTETLVAVVGQDFVMIGADTASVQSIVLTSSDMDKIKVVADPFPDEIVGDVTRRRNIVAKSQAIVVAAAGDLADVNQLFSTLKSHASIREYESSLGADVDVIDLAHGNTPRYGSDSSQHIPAGLSVGAIAKLARTEISQKLRSNAPYRVGLLVAGMQQEDTRTSNGASRRNFRMPSSFDSISRDVQQQLQRATSSVVQELHDKTSVVAEARNGDEGTSLLHKNESSNLSPCLFWLDEYGALQKIRYASHGMASNFLNAILDRNYHQNLSREQAAELIQSCFNQLQTRYVINSPKPPLIKCIDEKGCRIFGCEK